MLNMLRVDAVGTGEWSPHLTCKAVGVGRGKGVNAGNPWGTVLCSLSRDGLNCFYLFKKTGD